MIILTKSHILLLHSQLIKETGGSDGIRDETLLDAAINAPFQSFDGEDVFPAVQHKAARLGYGLVKNHAFIDGNKRIGAHAIFSGIIRSYLTFLYASCLGITSPNKKFFRDEFVIRDKFVMGFVPFLSEIDTKQR